MTDFFLKAKHWHIFLLIFALPLVLYMLFMVYVFSQSFANQGNPDELFRVFKFLPLIVLIPMITVFGWQWTLGIRLQEYIPDELKLKINLFKACIIVPFVYVMLMMVFMFYMFGQMDVNQSNPNMILQFLPGIGLIILPLHFFTIFAMFYNMYFIARTLKTVELKRKTTFGDYVGEFFLMWFYFVGVWIIQPKVNKIYSGESDYIDVLDSDISEGRRDEW